MARGFMASFLNKSLLDSFRFCILDERLLLGLCGRLLLVATDRSRPAFDSRRDIAIEQLFDGSVVSYGWLNALKRSQEFFEEDVVLKIRVDDEDIPDFSISNLSEVRHGANSDMSWIDFMDAIKNGEVKHILTPEENSCIFEKLHDGKNKVAFYVEGRPTLKINALIYRWSWGSTGHTRPCFNGALDSIFVKDDAGPVKNSGLFVSLSNSSECLREAERTDVKSWINGDVIPDSSIELNRLRRKSPRGTPMERLTPPENEQIFERLHEGRNRIMFGIGGGHPDSESHAYIFNWKPNSKVVISDIDATLTRSNGTGMANNFRRKDDFQPGICKLLWHIKLQGYEILYLTARPVSTIHATRQLLADNLEEKNVEKPPPGPVITCCYGRLHSTVHYVGYAVGNAVGTVFNVEQVRNKFFVSHENFKTDLLSRIRSDVFREEDNALFAGFGDTNFDFNSYSSAGIPPHRNFRVLKNGAIKVGDDEITISDFLERELKYPDRSIFPSLSHDVPTNRALNTTSILSNWAQGFTQGQD